MDKEKVEKLFRYTHLPDSLQLVSKPFHDLAILLVTHMDSSPELTLALRSLWESKNLTVYAAVEAND